MPRLRLPLGRLCLPLLRPPGPGVAELLVVALTDGRRACLGFTSPERLAECLGNDAVWGAWPSEAVPSVLAAALVEVLVVDAASPDQCVLDIAPLLAGSAR